MLATNRQTSDLPCGLTLSIRTASATTIRPNTGPATLLLSRRPQGAFDSNSHRCRRSTHEPARHLWRDQGTRGIKIAISYPRSALRTRIELDSGTIQVSI